MKVSSRQIRRPMATASRVRLSLSAASVSAKTSAVFVPNGRPIVDNPVPPSDSFWLFGDGQEILFADGRNIKVGA